MKNRRARGFTLIEILLVVGLVGIIASAALAPLVVTVRSLEEAQARWGRRHNARDAADAMYRDLRLALRNPSFQSVRIIHEESLGNDADDRLVMWSAAPKYEGKSAGVVVYRVLPEDSFSDDAPGLYRWVICGQPSLHAQGSRRCTRSRATYSALSRRTFPSRWTSTPTTSRRRTAS